MKSTLSAFLYRNPSLNLDLLFPIKNNDHHTSISILPNLQNALQNIQMLFMLICKMERIPYDIVINQIILYTYHVQPKELLQDIQNYCTIKSIIMKDPHHSTIKLQILMVCHFTFMSKLNTILHRNLVFKSKQYNYDNIKYSSLEKRFNILFGLLTKYERNSVLKYLNIG